MAIIVTCFKEDKVYQKWREIDKLIDDIDDIGQNSWLNKTTDKMDKKCQKLTNFTEILTKIAQIFTISTKL